MFFNLGGKEKMPLYIPKAVYDEIIAHAKDTYPNECCGILVGSGLKDKRVFESQRATNINTERANDRFIINPVEINIADKTARVQGLDILGFYHSHPDHPDKPSETDREWAQPYYSYVIVSVKGGKDVSMKSWTIATDNDPFKEEKIKITQKG